MKSLYDVFSAIRADEGDHVGKFRVCSKYFTFSSKRNMF
jgi:hypothetical protein